MIETIQSEQSITLTERAIRQAKALIAKRPDASEAYLRLAVRGGGCSGLFYAIDIDSETTDHDRLFEIDGIRVVIDRKSWPYLAGTELDYDITNLLEGGFKFNNPNARRSCGCGVSFQV